MHATRYLRFAFVGLLLLGCLQNRGEPPGVRYRLTFVAKGSDGKSQVVQEPILVESSAAGEEREEIQDGQKYLVRILKTQFRKATFEVIFPNSASHQLQVKLGQPKEVSIKGQRVGVRIEIEESH